MNKWSSSNTFLKIVAIGLAIMLWMIVNNKSFPFPNEEGNVTTTIRNVTLEVRGLDTNRYELTKMPKTVDLTLRGNAKDLEKISAGNYHVFINLRGLRAGKHSHVPIHVEGLPPGVSITRLTPKFAEIMLEAKQQKEMLVQVDVVGSPPAGYKTGEPIVKPTKVLVKGSETMLEKVTAVKAIVQVEGQTETVVRSVPLQVYGDHGLLDNLEVRPSVVDVEVPVVSPHATVPLKVDIFKEPPPGYAIDELEVGVDQVTVYGPKEYIAELDYYIGPRVDLSDKKQNSTFVLPIALIDEAIKVEPEKVEVAVRIVKSETKVIKEIPVQLIGLVGGIKGKVISPAKGKITITLEGAPRLLKKVGRNDVKAYIDVANLPPGEYERPVKISLPPFINLEGDPDITMKIRISK